MSYYALAALVNFLSCLLIAILILVRNPRGRVNRVFSLFAFCCSMWGLAYLFWQFSTNADEALFWVRGLMVPAIFIGFTFLHSILIFTGEDKNKKDFIRAGYVAFFLFLFADFTPYFIASVGPASTFPFWPKPGIAFHPFLALWGGSILYAVYLLHKKLKMSTGLVHSQAKYIIFGSCLGIIGGSMNYFLWYGINIPPVGTIFVTAFVCVAYAMINRRLTDTRMVARSMFMYACLSILVYAAFFGLVIFFDRVFGGLFNTGAYIASAFMGPLLVYIFTKIIKGIERLANTYIFSTLYTYQETITHLTGEIGHSTDINLITGSITNTLSRLGIDHVAVMSIDDGIPIPKIENSIGFPQKYAEGVAACAEFVAYLAASKKPLVSDEAHVAAESSKEIAAVLECIENYGVALSLPLFSHEKLTGIIVLGKKASGDAYTSEDLELLAALAYQAGIALENARLYKTVQDFNTNLQERVDAQTKDIQDKAKELESALKVKSDFIYLMSHQLRGPIAVITGMSSMLKDGDLENSTPEERREFVDGIYTKAKKLADILNDVIEVTSMEDNKYVLNQMGMRQTHLEDTVKDAYQELLPQAEEKGISFTYEAPKEPTPTITSDPHYLRHAIINIMDNAIKYTKQGYVQISVGVEGKNAVCTIKDTGIGIPSADKDRLFEKFVRAKNALEAYTYGTGLGLYISKSIIEAHPGGSISFTSEQGKGSTFKLSIPFSDAAANTKETKAKTKK